ncbi:craniofacial development protein 2-like [Palaemon carinicauda]|uniref:craniofacial development protein 2-like n=1 Tax=Palaemon carinicauda TaxID=392227 RepID=UPI0035B5992F
MSVIVCYAPTNDSRGEKKDAYYEELQRVIDELLGRDMNIVIGDFSANDGRNNQRIEKGMGVEGLGEVANEKVVHFKSFCSGNSLVIGGTLLQLKNIHEYTYTSPCGN